MAQSPWAKSAEYWLYQIHQALLSLTVTIDPGDVEIGAVEIKDGATDTRAKVGVPSDVTALVNVLGTHDPSVGLPGDAPVVWSASGTLIAITKGLGSLIVTSEGILTQILTTLQGIISVEGAQSESDPVTGNPVLAGGVDPAGNVKANRLDNAGRVPVRLDWIPIDPHDSGEDISSAVVLTPPAGARRILIQTLTQNVRYTLDGTTPTASVGFQLKAGNDPVVIPVDGGTLTVIQEAATASLQFQWLD